MSEEIHETEGHDNPTFVSDQDLAALTEEMATFDVDEAKLADKMFKESLPMAVQSTINLARSASSEAIRYQASKYVIERNLGKIAEKIETEGASWESLIGKTIETPDKV